MKVCNLRYYYLLGEPSSFLLEVMMPPNLYGSVDGISVLTYATLVVFSPTCDVLLILSILEVLSI